MKVIGILALGLVSVQAGTECATPLLEDATQILCGGTTNVNCKNYAKGGFCSVVDDANLGWTSVCCDSEDDAAEDIYELDTCGECLEDDDGVNVWDGKYCFGSDGDVPFPNALSNPALVLYSQAAYTILADCPENPTRLEMSGTCYKRCGTRGWGTENLNTNLNFNQGYGYPYGYNQGYGGFNQGYGGFNQGYGYNNQFYQPGQVRSVTGEYCPDPKRLEELAEDGLPSIANLNFPMFGGFGGNFNNFGYYGRQYVGSVYGGNVGGYGGYPQYGMQSMGGYGGYGGYSGYGGMQTLGYGGYNQGFGQQYGGIYGAGNVGGVYGGNVYGGVYGGVGGAYGSSVYSSVGGSTTTRCDPKSQCSCDDECSPRGDCCDDASEMGCQHVYDDDETR